MDSRTKSNHPIQEFPYKVFNIYKTLYMHKSRSATVNTNCKLGLPVIGPVYASVNVNPHPGEVWGIVGD